MENRQRLRKQLRTRRRSLSPQQQRQAALDLLQLLKRQPLFIRSRHIAFYLPNDGEIDPRPLIKEAWRRGKNCYLPVLKPCRGNTLHFVKYTRSSAMVANRFNIPEPVRSNRSLPPQQLDLVVLPLVGFDCKGGRMGMGGGFYDRTFAFKHRTRTHKPYLLGVAHHCQQVSSLPLESWDIPLNAIVTDKDIFAARPTLQQRDFSNNG